MLSGLKFWGKKKKEELKLPIVLVIERGTSNTYKIHVQALNTQSAYNLLEKCKKLLERR